ncbi:extracellular solute-binding protein [Actinopolymorpha sp. NPDC004070]|uniref:ABC transporter substrate-binding protein n=1 Tax=Actinopolymorpha sp. NPDC004070 TaxID=3154548 RepID=UPI0033A58720
MLGAIAMHNPIARRRYWVVFALAATSLLLAACGGGAAAGTEPLVVVVDSTRLAGVQQYQKLHPGVRLRIQVFADRAALPTKVLLDNYAADAGWPDVVFAEPNIVARTADSVHDFPLDLRKYVPKKVLDNFFPGSLASCMVDGRLLCLRNDLAQGVLWYNATLMRKFGYDVPTTWEEYQRLGLRVAKEHPGYVIGAFGDAQALNMYFWPSECPVAQIVGRDKVRINLAKPECTRVPRLFDPLIRAKVVTTVNPLDAVFVQKYGTTNKVLMMPAASWYAEYVFREVYKTPPGQLAAAMPLRWSSEREIRTGAHGGAAWMVSRHTTNVRAAVDLATWMSTATAYQGSGPTFPAYMPAADAWAKHLREGRFFATDPYPVMRRAAASIDPIFGSVRYDAPSLFESDVIGPVIRGRPAESGLREFESHLTQLAQAYGYTVVR